MSIILFLKIEDVEMKDENVTASKKIASAKGTEVSTEIVMDADAKESEENSSPTSTVAEKMNLRILLMPTFMLIGVTIVLTGLGISVFFNTAPALGKETGEF